MTLASLEMDYFEQLSDAAPLDVALDQLFETTSYTVVEDNLRPSTEEASEEVVKSNSVELKVLIAEEDNSEVLHRKKRARKNQLAEPVSPSSSTNIVGELLKAPRELQIKGHLVSPREFRDLLGLFGHDISKDKAGHLKIVDCTRTGPIVLNEKLGMVQNLMMYVLDPRVPVKERRTFDALTNLPGTSNLTWADQGNAHYVLDRAKNLNKGDGITLNPRKIQVAHALASRVHRLSKTEVPVIKCFYFALSERKKRTEQPSTPQNQEVRDDASIEWNSASGKKSSRRRLKAASGKTVYEPLGLRKHIYMMCKQSVQNRHQIVENKVWVIRYFVKGKLDPRLRNRVFE